VARAMVMMMRVAGNGEGEGVKAMARVARLAGKRMATVTKRAMVVMSTLGGAGGGDDQPLHTT
jgi:hypothetical protein